MIWCDILECVSTRYFLSYTIYGHMEHEINSACMQAMSKRYFYSFVLIIVNYHVKLSCSCPKFWWRRAYSLILIQIIDYNKGGCIAITSLQNWNSIVLINVPNQVKVVVMGYYIHLACIPYPLTKLQPLHLTF